MLTRRPRTAAEVIEAALTADPLKEEENGADQKRLQFVEGEPLSAVTAVCCTPVEIYCLDGDTLLSLGLQEDAQSYRYLLDEMAYRCPPDNEVHAFLQEKARWEVEKAHILKEIRRQRL